MTDHTHFRLIGRTNVFRLVRRYMAAEIIPSVYGEEIEGRGMTCARVADIEWCADPATPSLADVAAARTAAFVAARKAELAARDQVSGLTPDAAIAELEAALSAELAKRPDMVAQQCQQQQANAALPQRSEALAVGTPVVDRDGFEGTVVLVTLHEGSRWYDVRFRSGTAVRYDSDLSVRSVPAMVQQQAQQQQACTTGREAPLPQATVDSAFELANLLQRHGYVRGAVRGTYCKPDCRRVVIVRMKDGRFTWANV